MRIQEHELMIVNLLKSEFTKDRVEIPDNFYLASVDMEAGFCLLGQYDRDKYKHVKSFKKMVLFLSDNNDAFLEIIRAGELHQYSEVKSRLKHCKSVLDTSSIKECILQQHAFKTKEMSSEEFMEKYKSMDD